MKQNYPIVISEKDGASHDEFVYLQSQGENELIKVNASLTALNCSSKVVGLLKDIFLPRGYPNSVSQDYVQYQIWDTVQACCSTITSTLATKAILQGIGVGNSAANSTSAAVAWILKDGIGLMSRIAFAWGIGSGLDGECKKWRMFADIMNDLAIFVELVVLSAYSEHATYILCFSTSLKGLVGVAGGSTRAAITQHQAIKENMADVSAKDGSQETCVNLLASIIGVVLLSYFENTRGVWFLFFTLTYLHLYANYRAVKSLNFNYFNNERFVIFLKNFLLFDLALPPEEVNERESVLIGFGDSEKSLCGHRIKIGCSLDRVIKKKLMPFQVVQFLAHMYKSRKYMIVLSQNQSTIYIYLDARITPKDILEAYFHAIVLGIGVSYLKDKSFPHMKYHKSHSKMLNSLFDTLKKKQTWKQLVENEGLDVSLLMAIDNIASLNVNDCLQKATNKGWNVEKNLIPADKWRAYWGDHRSDNEN